MNFNTDGFNERSNYIHNQNDVNRLKMGKSHHYDNSLARMRIAENKPDIKTVNRTISITNPTKIDRSNFLLRSSNIRNVAGPRKLNSSIQNTLNKNKF